MVFMSIIHYPFWTSLALSLEGKTTAGCKAHDKVCACIEEKKRDPLAVRKSVFFTLFNYYANNDFRNSTLTPKCLIVKGDD